MGLARKPIGCANKNGRARNQNYDRTIAIVGNPNVGKSTLFNALTGLDQHTGNWAGKTVEIAEGSFVLGNRRIRCIDIPGTYSLVARSPEEEIARSVIESELPDLIVAVCDATCLERNLVLALQILDLGRPTVICVNLLDEARRKGIEIDLPELSRQLGAPVVGTIARKRHGLDSLSDELHKQFDGISTQDFPPPKSRDSKLTTEDHVNRAHAINAIVIGSDPTKRDRTDRILDALFTGRKTAYPIMLACLALIFWLTVSAANYPSALLAELLFYLGDKLSELLSFLNCNQSLHSLLIDGIYHTLSRVISVMLPPMAIFFPLFTLLEDFGYLPRVAFNLDKPFHKCKSCGKQALTMCMGFGCNAAGVVGCRIIDSPRERLIDMLTNCFVPCNGRFPLLISLITMFFAGAAYGLSSALVCAIFLTLFILIGIIMTFITSRLLSETLLRGIPSAFTIELPPYRPPQVGRIIIRSIFDRTVFVLGRAVVSAIPAGVVIWILANVSIGNIPLLSHLSNFLDPFASLLGLDGVILLAFILALPANEIVIPIIIMCYTSAASLSDKATLIELRELFIMNGWTLKTAVCTIIFSLFHWPCATTLLTVKKESGSAKWMLAAAVIPTLCGVLLCFAVNLLFAAFS